MVRDIKSQAEQFARGMRMLEQVRRFSGAPAQFYQALIETTGLLTGAELALLLRRGNTGDNGWQRVGIWPSDNGSVPGGQAFLRVANELASAASEKEAAGAP